MDISLKLFITYFNINSFLDKLDNFRKLDLRTITNIELQKEIIDVISVQFGNSQISHLLRIVRKIEKGTNLYRIRKIERHDLEYPLKSMRRQTDAWNPPNNIIKKMGRLNKVGESLLYVSLNPKAAMKEMKIQENDRFALIVYEAKEEIKAINIGVENNLDKFGFLEEEKAKVRLIERFLCDEFTRDVGEGTEFLYRASEMIAKDYFDLPPGAVQDAWCYQSVASKQEINLCFRPTLARKKMKLRGVIICKCVQGEILCEQIVYGYKNNGIFNYFPIGSDIQREVFPEITNGF